MSYQQKKKRKIYIIGEISKYNHIHTSFVIQFNTRLFVYQLTTAGRLAWVLLNISTNPYNHDGEPKNATILLNISLH